MEQSKLLEIEKIIEIKFNNIKNLERAFIHSSYANHYGRKSNERLEYLGDSILNFVTSDFLFNFTSMNEGDLSKIGAKLVGKENLSKIVTNMGLQKYIMYYPETIKSFSKKELCDLFESIIAVIYIDKGMEEASKFIHKFLPLSTKNITVINEKLKDFKSSLQELLQERHILPEYKVIEEKGPDHAKIFKMGVYVEKMLIAVGTVESKKVAENIAAKNALIILKK
ncbi:MAG: ribonuclease III [Clostridia bacterium]|nr:ribonuclease III [Clostridia bacterium]